MEGWGTIFLTFTGTIYLIMMAYVSYRIKRSTESTSALVNEIKEIRKEESKPYVVIDIKPKEQAPQILEVKVANIGGGPAFNIKCGFQPDIVYRKESGIMLSDLPIFKGLAHLAPGEQTRFFFAAAVEYMTCKNNPKEFEAKTSYSDIFGDSHEKSYHIDLTVRTALLFAEEKGLNDVVVEIERLTREVCWLRKNIETFFEKDVEETKRPDMGTLKGIYREMKR